MESGDLLTWVVDFGMNVGYEMGFEVSLEMRSLNPSVLMLTRGLTL